MKLDHIDVDAWESIKDFFKFMAVVGAIWAILFFFLGCAHIGPTTGPDGQGKCEGLCVKP